MELYFKAIGKRILIAKPVFKKEAKEIFSNCNDYEVRILLDILKATKEIV